MWHLSSLSFSIPKLNSQIIDWQCRDRIYGKNNLCCWAFPDWKLTDSVWLIYWSTCFSFFSIIICHVYLFMLVCGCVEVCSGVWSAPAKILSTIVHSESDYELLAAYYLTMNYCPELLGSRVSLCWVRCLQPQGQVHLLYEALVCNTHLNCAASQFEYKWMN